MEQERTDELAETLGRLEVADTLEDLRLNIDALIERLSSARSEEPSPSAEDPGPTAVLDRHIEDLGLKVEGATDLLAELADLLDAQSERIETIEQQIGDPDEVPFEPEPEPEPASRAPEPPVRDAAPVPESVQSNGPGVDAFAIAEVLRDLKFWLDDRFARIENAVSRLDVAVADVRDLGAEGDRRVRELEDRLLILVDSGLDRSTTEPTLAAVPVESFAQPSVQGGLAASESAPVAMGMAPVEPNVPQSPPPLNLRHRPVPEARPEFSSEPEYSEEQCPGFGGQANPDVPAAAEYRPAANFTSAAGGPQLPAGPQSYGPMDGTAARRLEELVEREVRLQQSFVPGADVPPAADAVRADRRRPTVMVVDDSADARTILSIYLSKTGYQVVTAASAEDCLAKLHHHSVDAVILDSSMPGGGGAHVCRVLRDDPQYEGRRSLPIIVYTAHPDAFSREEATGLGATDYVIKSGDMLPLITSLVRHTTTQGR